jgi:SAM-dependent methyltransferase
MELESRKGQVRVLMSKKGCPSIKIKRQQKIAAPSPVLQHNRQKSYILEEGTPVPFLVDLGVMTAEGKIIASRYDKFRQINRFLEFIEDILPRLDKSRENVIIDFGCGKSYLTFAMYYYLHELKGYSIRVIGLDLKQTVIDDCNRLGERYGYDMLKFYHGDIASYEGVDHVDMVVTLHACDTATDYAMAKAVRWGASVILSVPCCQHELNKTMDQELMAPVFQYGLIRERMAALYTDALRAEILENQGYRTQILEFIDMEHTPKNILIRGVKQGGKKDNRKEIQEIMEFLHGKLTLADLLLEEDMN